MDMTAWNSALNGGLRWLALGLVALAGLELLWLHRRGQGGYDWRETTASLGVMLGQQLSGVWTAALVLPVYGAFWTLRPWTVPLDQPWAWLLLGLGVEFFYYWQHRAGHELRWFWASHSVHHTVQHYNLSAAYRLGWPAGVSGLAFFYLPLAWLGFHPGAIFAMLALNLLYQFGLHTVLVPRLGWLEWVLNTPAHHRIHHASNPCYLDANYGGVLIVFDRWFGTFRAEQANEPPVYGLVQPLHSHNPVVIALHAWGELLRDLWQARSWGERWAYLVQPPGWQPQGGCTSRELQACGVAAAAAPVATTVSALLASSLPAEQRRAMPPTHRSG